MASTPAGTPTLRSRDEQPPLGIPCPIEDALRTLGSEAEGGISTTEAAERLARHGRNDLPETAGRGIARMVLEQTSDSMILVLIAAAIVSGLVGEPADTIAILVIVLLNATIGIAQEWRAERGAPPVLMLLTAVSLAVAAIPEALPTDIAEVEQDLTFLGLVGLMDPRGRRRRTPSTSAAPLASCR